MASPLTEDVIRFRTLVAYVAEQLDEDNRDKMLYIYNLPVSYKRATTLDVLLKLEMLGVFSSCKPHDLVEVLNTLKRIDLAKYVEKRIKKQPKKKGKGNQQPSPKDSLMLKARFDHLYLQALHLNNQADDLCKELAEERHARHQRAESQLLECRDAAGKLARMLKAARSLAKLSEGDFVASLHTQDDDASVHRETVDPSSMSPILSRKGN